MFMKALLCIVALLCVSQSVSAQWIKQMVNTTASFRGLSVVDEKIIWASGTDGTVIKTIDGGKTWKVMTVPGAGKLDFRDIEAFDAITAYILSIGDGESSRIYKTVDGGKNWNEQFRNPNEKAFFDAIACWDKNNCIAMSDPVNKKFVFIETKNGGANWTPIDASKMPKAKEGEAAFAASGTCLITQGKNNAFLVTGGSDARVFKSTDRGKTWMVYNTPMAKGTPGSGIFSIAMYDDKRGVIVGGNYEKPLEGKNNLAVTRDGGITWELFFKKALRCEVGEKVRLEHPMGYRSAVTYVSENLFVASGTTGSEIGDEYGWFLKGTEDLNAVQSKGIRTTWAVGPKGMVVKMQ